MNDLPRLKTSPKDFFLHLLAIVTLYISATSLGTIFFQLINIYLPDPLLARDFYYDAPRSILRGALSFIIIMFPAYVWTSWYLNKIYLKDNAKRELRIRKWLIYFTLFISALVMLFSVVFILQKFLEGDLTWRFFLKLFSVIAIAAAVFNFYIWDIKRFSKNNEE